jgi:REP element-mobilizing transposase RayT
MNRGAARQPTFGGDGDYQGFLDTVAEAHRQWGIEVFAYSLMRNHYHLCLRTPAGNLSRVMRHIDGIYTQRFNRRHRRDGVLFRGRYKAILVDADEYLAAVVRYIHLNAVEAGIVQMPEDYRWASHRYYLEAKGLPGWLNTQEALEQIGDRQAFHEFVLSGNEEVLKHYYEAQRQSPILGNEGFIERVRHPVGGVAKEYARYERRVVQVGPERVIGFGVTH